MVYILNSAVLTNFGTFKYSPISLTEAKELLLRNEFISAVGHEETAKLMSTLFEIEIPTNRISVKMEKGDVAIVFRIKTRLGEGEVLSEEKLKEMMDKIEIGLMEKIE